MSDGWRVALAALAMALFIPGCGPEATDAELFNREVKRRRGVSAALEGRLIKSVRSRDDSTVTLFFDDGGVIEITHSRWQLQLNAASSQGAERE